MRAIALLTGLMLGGCFDYDYLSRNSDVDGNSVSDAGVAAVDGATLPLQLAFTQLAILMTPRSASEGLVLQDFDRDGRLDIAATSHDANSFLEIYTGNGDGTFRFSGENQIPGVTPQVLVAGNFDGNVLVDLATCNASSGDSDVFLDVSVISPAQSLQLTESPAAASLESIVAVDLDGDTLDDLVTVDTALNGVYGHFHDKNGAFGGSLLLATLDHPISVVAGDFDHSGKPSIAVAEYDNSVTILTPTGTHLYAPKVKLTLQAPPVFLVAHDLDGDGNLDLAVVSEFMGVTILWGDGKGMFSPSNFIPIAGNGAAAIGVADLDLDGYAELVVVDSQLMASPRVHLLPGLPGRQFGPERILADVSGAEWVSIGDLDRDGLPDLVIPEDGPGGGILVLHNTSTK